MRNALFALLFFLGISCESSTDVHTYINEGGTISVTAGSHSYTRTEIADNGLDVSWVETDILGMYMAHDGQIVDLKPYITTAGSMNGTVRFTGEHVWEAPGTQHTFYSYYPYDDLYESLDPTKVPVTLPKEQLQSGEENTHIGDIDFLVAPPVIVTSPADITIGGNLPFTFKHAFSLIELRFKTSGYDVPHKIKSVTVISALDALAVEDGFVDITLNADDPNFGLVQGGVRSDSIHLNFQEDNLIIPNDEEGYLSTYVLVLPGDRTTDAGNSKTMTVAIHTDQGKFSFLKTGMEYERGHKYVSEYTIAKGETPPVWDGTAKEPERENVTVKPEGGESVPVTGAYIIRTPSELYWLSLNPPTDDITIVFENDINLGNRPWTPIGTANSAFKGHVYGQGHTISGLYVEGNYAYAGLFGLVSPNGAGIIQNLNITGTIISTAQGANVGGVIGSLTRSGQKLSNVSFYGILSGDSGSAIVGGVVGVATNSTIMSNCDFGGEASGYIVGGVLGRAGAAVTLAGNSINRGAINASYIGGGIIGEAGTGALNLQTAFNYGNVTGGSSSNGSAGGIVGVIPAGITLTNCYNIGGTVTGYTAGGLVGLNDTGEEGKLISCYNTGNVSGNLSNGHAGGLGGHAHISYTDCFNSGQISAYYAGGLAGAVSLGKRATIERCFNKGSVSTGSTGGYGGGLAGHGYADISNSYNSGDVKAYVSAGIIGFVETGWGWSMQLKDSYNSGIISTYSGGTRSQFYGGVVSNMGAPSAQRSYTNSNINQQGLILFGASTWPSGWTVSATNGWRTVGSWNGGNPTYPRLWFDLD